MLAIVASCLIVFPGIDSTRPRPITQLVHTRWSTRDGAPAEVRALAQTPDGYLWVGTRSGLVRFDGVRFVQLTSIGGDTLPSSGVRSLLAARDSSLWIVWRSGAVSRIRNGRLTSYGERDGLPVTNRLAESSTGMLVAGTAQGLSHFTDGTWRDFGRELGYPGTQGWAVWFDRQDALWVETERRVVYLPRGAQQFVDPGMPLAQQPSPADFAEASDGSIWMAEVQRSVHTVPRRGEQSPLTQVLVGSQAMLIDRKGSMWIGTVGDGLRRVADPALIRGRAIGQFSPEAEPFTEKDGLLSDVVLALLEDREGNIWIGSERGLERFREGAFTPLATPGSVRSRVLFHTRDSSVWTATYNVLGLQRVGPGGQETIPGLTVTNLSQDSSGVLWMVDNASLFRLQGRRFTRFPLRKSDARHLLDITIDPAGTIWVFDQQLGLMRLSGDSLVQEAPVNQASLFAYLFSDRAGRVWIGQPFGITLYDHGIVRRFAASQGEAPASVHGFFEDRDGTIWAASEGGLSRFEAPRFRNLHQRQGIPGRAVYGIADDEEGAWWIATRFGLLRLPPGEATRAFADSGYAIQYRTFDGLDGLPGLITTSSYGAVVTRSADGRIWVATDSGVASLHPQHLDPVEPPQVLIEAARINGRELQVSEGLVVPPRSKELEIDYTAASLSMPERVQFRYMLEGEDDGWHDVGTRRRAYYGALAPGEYRFHVSAHNGDGSWSEPGAVLAIRVLPAWYQTLLFKTGVVLLIGLLGAATAVLVVRGRHQRSQEILRGQYEATLAERARIAQDLHDTLLQGFTGISLQLKAAERQLLTQPDVAAVTVDRLQKLADETLREARERVWHMRETAAGRDDLPTAFEAVARERTAGTGMEVTVATSGECRRLADALEDGAFRIGREAIVNAVRHSGARHIDIRVDFGPTALRVEVQDDGRGFDPAHIDGVGQQGHFGLIGARDRATQLGGRCEVLPRPGGGTIVSLELPFA